MCGNASFPARAACALLREFHRLRACADTVHITSLVPSGKPPLKTAQITDRVSGTAKGNRMAQVPVQPVQLPFRVARGSPHFHRLYGQGRGGNDWQGNPDGHSAAWSEIFPPPVRISSLTREGTGATTIRECNPGRKQPVTVIGAPFKAQARIWPGSCDMETET